MPKQIEITPEVRAVLECGSWEGWLFRLPVGQLDRDLYVAVDKVLAALGGKWNRRQRGHMFGLDAKEALVAALESGVAVDRKRTAEQFFTPLVIAERVWACADLEAGHHVLEPSAGEGVLLNEPLRLGCRIDCVESDERLCEILGPLAVTVYRHDFITWFPPEGTVYDRVIMNPPFGRGADMAHVLRALAFLRPGGVLVAIMSPHWTFARDALANNFRVMLSRMGDAAYDWEPLPDGSFKSSGTNVSTGILTIRKGDE